MGEGDFHVRFSVLTRGVGDDDGGVVLEAAAGAAQPPRPAVREAARPKT